MNKRITTTLSASALLFGTAVIGIASAADRNAADAKAAAGSAAKATKALSHHDGAAAIVQAEAAVALAPRDAGYRVLLGQSYLAAGRFVSARTAFGDALSLAPTNGKAALNLTLSQIATGDWAGARRTLDDHDAVITPADKGLALALAGNPQGAVQLLTQVARSSETSPKVRQNLALSLALAGDWPSARAVAAVDMSPADVDARLEQWASFARPHAASDQVAALLGVTAAADTGQPVQLALGGEPPVAIAAVAAPVPPAPVPASAPNPVEAAPAPVAVAPVEPRTQASFAAALAPASPHAELVAAAAAPGEPSYARSGPTKVVFDVRGNASPVTASTSAFVSEPAPAPAPVVTAVPTLRPQAKPTKVAIATAAPTTRGNFVVQLGAFQSSAVAHDAWNRATRRMPVLVKHGPSGMNFTAHKTNFYRLSVGGFSRAQAMSLCHRYRTTGGACFVRAGAGDQVAAWVRKGAQLASR